MALIKQLMKSELVTASPGDSVRKVAALMARNRVGAVLVVEDAGGASRLRGLFSERDLLQRVVVPGLDPDATPVSSVMTREAVTVTPETPVRECADLIRQRGFRHVPVLEGGRPVGILSSRDFQEHVVRGLESLISNDRYREALAEGLDPYDHLGGGYES